MDFIAEIDIGTTPTDETIDAALDALGADYGAVASPSPEGQLHLTLDLPADGLLQASQAALALASVYGPPVTLSVLPRVLRDTREGIADASAWLSMSDAAALIGVTRQRASQLRAEGVLQARRLGARAWLVSRASALAYKAQRQS